jgi:hypothetical protein
MARNRKANDPTKAQARSWIAPPPLIATATVRLHPSPFGEDDHLHDRSHREARRVERIPSHRITGRRVDGSTEEIFGGRGAEGNSSYTEVERGEIPLYSDGAAALSGLGRYPAGGSGGQEECPCVRSQAISPRASFRNPTVGWRRRARGSCTAIPADRGGQSDSSLTAGGQDRLSGSRRGSWR